MRSHECLPGIIQSLPASDKERGVRSAGVTPPRVPRINGEGTPAEKHNTLRSIQPDQNQKNYTMNGVSASNANNDRECSELAP